MYLFIINHFRFIYSIFESYFHIKLNYSPSSLTFLFPLLKYYIEIKRNIKEKENIKQNVKINEL